MTESSPTLHLRPSEWARSTRQGLLEIREGAKAHGLDEPVLVQGYTYFIILLDDENAFIPTFQKLNGSNKKSAIAGHMRAIHRLHSDLLLPDLSGEIKEQMNRLLANLEATDVDSTDFYDERREIPGYFSQELASNAHASIVERLDWEAQVAELPADIHHVLSYTHRQIAANDFATESNFRIGHYAWMEMHDWLSHQRKERVGLENAIQYFKEHQYEV